LQASRVEELDAAFQTAASTATGGLVVSADSIFGGTSDSPVVPLAERYRLPVIYSQVQQYVNLGGLMAYSPNFRRHTAPSRGLGGQDSQRNEPS
jgi:hypothetical protein